MTDSTAPAVHIRPPLPRTVGQWLRVFGPGAVMASLTIGTGELIFSTRGGALFGFDILFVFVIISVLKWGLVAATSRHMVLTGIHPYQRMMELPGPRGWLPISLLVMSAVAMPIWISFHSGVIGNLTSWITGTRGGLYGGIDYVWGASILAAVLVLSATGGYSVLERLQMLIVVALMFCAGLSLLLYNPPWLQLLAGALPSKLAYPEWLAAKYPAIHAQSVWVETTRYVGVIGGAGFDYLAYTSWLREKNWGILPEAASARQIEDMAADPWHPLRRWTTAPLLDSAISFLLVILFSAVFIASGALFLGPHQLVPDENNLLNEQARLVTNIHEWLLPLYVIGAFLTMLGTLYGTVAVAVAIADEIFRALRDEWTEEQARTLQRAVVGWCGTLALGILLWLLIRQAQPVAIGTSALNSSADPAPLEKPKLLLAILTPVNLFTGVLSCGLICFLTLWMDQRWLPRALRAPLALRTMNALSGFVLLGLGIMGCWQNENRTLVFSSMAGLFAAGMLVASFRDRLIGRENSAPISQDRSALPE